VGSEPQCRPGRDEDVGAVVELLSEAAQLVRDREGRLGWPFPFPVEEVRAAAARGELRVLESDGRVVASYFLVWEDPRFWGPQPPIAGYLHKLAVRADQRGRGLGAAALDRAAAEVAAAGRSFLRLDCLASQERLVGFYRRAGFESVREIDLGPATDRRRFLLMERSVGRSEPARSSGVDPKRSGRVGAGGER
jgi:ribosomal protein S18 acetylase RimI-like enzyme